MGQIIFIFVIFTILVLGYYFFKWVKSSDTDVNNKEIVKANRKFLEELWTNGKITDDTYKEYIKKLDL